MSYILGPMIGAFFAGNVFSFQKRIERRLLSGDLDESDDEEEDLNRFDVDVN